MLYQREKRLLGLLEALGGRSGSIDFQKLLFLFCQEAELQSSYSFVPYRFGAFSFTSYAGKRRLIMSGLLLDDDQAWQLTEKGRAAAREVTSDTRRMQAFCKRYGQIRGDALVAETYRRYPYYAIRSEILPRLKLEPEALERIEKARPARQACGLVTIGYEGRNLEDFVNELLGNGVTLLCDVRRNPVSRKYGFAKSTLSKACEGVGIRYEHLPELGIDSEDRRALGTQEDYDRLFAAYEREQLPRQGKSLARIRNWIAEGERVALTCYERRREQCHRNCVVEALECAPGKVLRAIHL